MKTDVLILGGGPAGATTALLMARAGLSVTLCEAHATLPERVCGMYLCPAGAAMLERLGLPDRLGADARRLIGMAMVAPNFERLETFFPTNQGVPDHGLALPRPQLDNTLLDLAREAGALVKMGARPTIGRTPGGWRDLPAALDRYARLRARRQHAKALLCEAFQHIIRRPWLANSTHWLLSRRQPVADAFIGVVGNSYPPAHGLALMARHAFSP